MGKKKEIKEALVPPQDRKICGGICLCQFTVVISCVAVIYLSVAVYMPSYRAFTYGMEPDPVMCQTVNTTMLTNYCDWASCGEWCLTKTSGFCPQVHVTTRRNGTTIMLEGCQRGSSFSCPKAKPEKVTRYNCNKDNECATLTGVFNCSLGHCANMSELFLCHNHADGIQVDSDKDNLKLNGFFECNRSRCLKYRKNLNCDRYCPKITTSIRNVFLQYDNNVFTGNCRRAIAFNEANGNQIGKVIKPTEIWTEQQYGILLASCDTVVQNGSSLLATDCINGTVVSDTDIPGSYINFTTYWTIVENSTKPLDPSQRFLPPQQVLTIYNYSRLYINLEGCVNTLMGECFEFVNTHGNDGDNKTAQSRFPCFYRKNDTFMVVSRFDLQKTWIELMIAIFVPTSLFIISFITLIVVGHSVYVGDDTKMRCTICRCKRKKRKTPEEINAEMDLVMDGIIERTNAIAESPDGLADTQA